MKARFIFAENMKRIRKKMNLSQEELADKAGFHRTYIGSVERGERNVSIDAIERISFALETPIYNLFMEIKDE
jgi:transcriptional regulator with XRE-family HTH domain